MTRYHQNGFKILNENYVPVPRKLNEQHGPYIPPNTLYTPPTGPRGDASEQDPNNLSDREIQALIAGGFAIGTLGPMRSLRYLKKIAEAIGWSIRQVLTLFSVPLEGLTVNDTISNFMAIDGVLPDTNDPNMGTLMTIASYVTEDDYGGSLAEPGNVVTDSDIAVMLEWMWGMEPGSMEGQVGVGELHEMLEALYDSSSVGAMYGFSVMMANLLGLAAGGPVVIPTLLIMALYMLGYGALNGVIPPGFGGDFVPAGIDPENPGNVIGPGVGQMPDDDGDGVADDIPGTHTDIGTLGTYYDMGGRVYY
tara:strand:- start:2085 stop:3005 length:921 start_codon:yes stop_codon:yes gene_type:complete